MVKKVASKTATVRAIKPQASIEVEESESMIMQEYKKLNEQCDIILSKISQRKQTKSE
jgi:hypothetical protein